MVRGMNFGSMANQQSQDVYLAFEGGEMDGSQPLTSLGLQIDPFLKRVLEMVALLSLFCW
jgi:hypothetical protein